MAKFFLDTVKAMNDDIPLTVNQRIKKLRSELSLTQKDFSKIITVSDGLIACIETGKREANERTIKLICDSFQVNREWLKTGKGDMFARELELKYNTLMALFSNLKPKYQDYIIDAIDRFLKIQDE